MNRRSVATLLAVVFAVAPVAGCWSSGEQLGPDETVEHVTQRLAEGHPVALWQALPASYQEDVTGLVHEFAGKMDRNLWNKTFGVVAKLTRLLREKRHLILEHPLVARHIADSGSTNIDGDWEGFVGVVDLLATSELADLDELAKLDIEAFLSGTGERLVRQVAAASSLAAEGGVGDYAASAESLREVKATVVSAEGDRATVRIEVPGEDPRTEPLVRVEGKWIPATLADGWQSQMAKARESISKMSSEEMKQEEQAMLLQLSMVEGALDTLLAAETADEFNAGVGAIMGGVMGMALGAAMNQGMEMTSGESAAGSDLSIVFTTPPGAMSPDLASAMRPAAASPDPASLRASSSATSMGTGSPLEVNPQPVDLSLEVTRRAHSIGSPAIPVGQANRFVGLTLRIVGADGLDTVAKLTKADGETLTFEQALGGGVMSFKVRKQEIESLRAAN
jgi:hypothetical protein